VVKKEFLEVAFGKQGFNNNKNGMTKIVANTV
jgi:hypothetical protein